jgi:hypothetical protein
MDGLMFYQYGFPLLLAAALVSLFLTVYRDKNLPDTHCTGIACLTNYSLANVFYVWAWDSATQWREGLLIISTLLVILLTIAQMVFAFKIRRSGSQTWLAALLFGGFLFLNLPITLISLVRSALSS